MSILPRKHSHLLYKENNDLLLAGMLFYLISKILLYPVNLAKRNWSFSETNAVKLLADLPKSKGPCVVNLVFLIKVDLSAPCSIVKGPFSSPKC